MRNRPDLLARCMSLLFLGAALVACFLVVMLSWPEPRERGRAALARSERCCAVVVGTPFVDGADPVPAAAQTASFSSRAEGIDQAPGMVRGGAPLAP